MLQLLSRGGESDQSLVPCWGCDKKQLFLNDSDVKQAAGDICQHSGNEELQPACKHRLDWFDNARGQK